MKRSRDIQSFFQKKRKESEPATSTSSSEKVQSGQQLRYSSSEEQSAPSAQDANQPHPEEDQAVYGAPPAKHGTLYSDQSDSEGISVGDGDSDDREDPHVAQVHAVPPGPHDISQARAEGPTQPQLKVFPRTMQGNRKRCFNNVKFLTFFFSRLCSNQSGRYEEDFPFLSLCGRERNFVRCDDRPIVFTHLLQSPATSPGIMGDQELLSYCGGAEKLSSPFRPEALYMHPVSGRVYHPCSERGGGVGLVRSALAIELSPFFVYAPEHGQSGQPTHFLWGGQKHTLTNELAGCFPTAGEGSGKKDELG